MAYIFDPLRNTFIDDEDTSLGNKLAFLDEDLQKAMDKLNEKYGPGTIKTLNQLPENKPAEVEDTERFNRFNRMYEDGGFIGGGTISGEDYGDRTGFNTPQAREALIKYNQKVRAQKILDIQNFVNNFESINGRLPTRDEIRTLGRFDYQFIKDRIDAGDIQALSTEESRVLGRKKVNIKDRSKKVRATKSKNQPFIITEETPGKRTKQTTGKVLDVTFPTEEMKNNYLKDLKKIYDQKYRRIFYKGPGVLTTEELAKKYFGKANSFTISKIGKMNTFFADQLGLKFETLPVDTKTQEVAFRRRTRMAKAKKQLSDREKLINAQQDKLVNEINEYYRKFPTEIINNERLTNAILARMNEDGTIRLKTFNSFDEKNNYLKKIALSDVGTMSVDHIQDVKSEKKNVEFPINRQLAPTKTNQSLITRAQNILKNNLNKTDSASITKVNNVIQSLKNLGLRVNVGGKVYGAEIIPAIDSVKGTLPNMDRAINIFNLSDVVSKTNFKINPSLIDNTQPIKTTEKPSEGTSFKSSATSLKDKLDKSRMLTSRIPGGAVALTPLDFILSMSAGLPLTESLASAGSYLIKDPYLGKAVNIPLAIAQDMQDPEAALQKGIERGEKAEAFLQELIDRVKEGAGDQPDIDPFQAADGGRVNFNSGGAAGADNDFAAQLEYFFLNPDAELPAAQTFRETMNPISIINDMINPRNIPYYADRLVESGIRIGEFGARILPAIGKLASDLIRKPAFKITGTGNNYVQDYDEVLPSNIRGTGIFSEFLNNLVGDEGTKAISEKTGLAKLIRDEEQKMKDERKTAGAKILADQLTLGMELTAPIFPGLKLLKAYAKSRNLPVNKTTEEIMNKEINEVLKQRGMNRREFLQATGAGATVILAKMLGFGDDITRTAKVAEKVAEKTTTSIGVPPYFFKLVEKIKKHGKPFEPEYDARVENNLQYGGFELRENMTTGEITIGKIKEGGFGDYDGIVSDETISYKPGESVLGKDGKYYRTVEEYDEFTARPDEDGKMKDVEPGLDSIEEIIQLLPNQLKMSELEKAGYNVNAFPDNIKQLLIDDLQKTN